MRRRLLELPRDREALLAMHRVSWELNFPGQDMSELAFIASLRGGSQRQEVYVYEVDDTVVAALWVEQSTPRLGVHIRQLQVRKDHWGQGIGRCLAEDAIAIAEELGAPRVTLNVTKDNERAMRLYEDLGFVAVEDHGDRQRMKRVLRTRPIR